MKKVVIDEYLTLVQGTLEQWLAFRKYLLKAFSDEEIGPDDETDFLDIKSNVARNVRTMSERIKGYAGLDYGDKMIRELLNKCVSANTLRTLPEKDQSALLTEWHKVFIRLSRSVGALKFMSEGYVPPAPGTGKKGKKGKKKGGNKGVAIGVGAAVVVVVGVVVAYFLGFVG